MIRAIVGANWGDEGKGKLTDMFAAESDIVVRFQGGANAGHTIINPYGRFSLHMMPSGVFHQHITNVVGTGTAFNVEKLIEELEGILGSGVPAPKLLISERAQMMMPYHILFDQYEEVRLGKNSFGSTKSGIAPFYADKYAKTGFQVCELFDEAALKEKLARVIEPKNVLLEHLYHQPKLDADELFTRMMNWRDAIAPYIGDVHVFLRDAVKQGKNILLEGQLGAMRDPDWGIYPMVTSSNTLAGYSYVGAGLPPVQIDSVVAVVKAYSSAVGAGPFVSEIFGDEAEELRRRGGDKGEYGATTGRPRRMGWFDCVATRYGCAVQGATEAALTILDALSYRETIPVCTGYEIDGTVIRDFPVTPRLGAARPVFEELPGWGCDITGIRDFEELPQAAKEYVRFIERQIETPVTMVCNGPGREDIIFRNR